MARRGDLNVWWRLGLVVVGSVVRVLFRIRVIGAERVPPAGPAIVASNHLSALDGVVLAVVVGGDARRMTRFLTGAEFFRKPQFGWALRLFRQIPIHRGTGDEGALDKAIKTVRSGALAGIFPEGLVNPEPDGGLQRGRTGVARIALAARSPVVPVGIWGTQERWPRTGLTWRRPWRTKVALSFGAPLLAEGDPADPKDTQRMTALVMEGIEKAVEEARRAGSGDARSSAR